MMHECGSCLHQLVAARISIVLMCLACAGPQYAWHLASLVARDSQPARVAAFKQKNRFHATEAYNAKPAVTAICLQHRLMLYSCHDLKCFAARVSWTLPLPSRVRSCPPSGHIFWIGRISRFLLRDSVRPGRPDLVSLLPAPLPAPLAAARPGGPSTDRCCDCSTAAGAAVRDVRIPGGVAFVTI